MAEFQSILGVVLIISSIVIIVLAIYNLVIIGKATIDTEDAKSKITDGEKKGALGVNVIMILIGLVLGIYGIVLLLPEQKATAGLSSIRSSRSMSSSVLAQSGQYM